MKSLRHEGVLQSVLHTKNRLREEAEDEGSGYEREKDTRNKRL